MPADSTGSFLSHQHLVAPRIWDRVTTDLVVEHDFSDELAEQTFNETLGFLLLRGQAPGRAHYPPPLIGRAWRTFITYTKAYSLFCILHGGPYGFIHHEPPRPSDGHKDHLTVVAIMAAMKQRHIPIDTPEVWHKERP